AATIGMVDSGLLTPGMAADITVFDPATIIDHATFEDPTRPSEGVRFVLVNGRVAVRDGRPTGEQGGLALARTMKMPTRPMNSSTRSVSRRGKIGKTDVAIDLTQDAGAKRASGTVRLSEAKGKIIIDMKELGILQTTGDWASITGRARLHGSDAER